MIQTNERGEFEILEGISASVFKTILVSSSVTSAVQLTSLF